MIDTMSGCLVITGTPGAGKTTVSQLAAEALPRSARLDGDVMGHLMVSGWASYFDERGRWRPDAEAQRQLRLRTVNVCSVASNFAEAGYTPVVDHVVASREELAFMADRLRARPLMLVVLAPPLEVARHRNATRPVDHRVHYDFAPLAAAMRRELGGVGWWLDSGEMTPEATASAVVAEAAERAVVTKECLAA